MICRRDKHLKPWINLLQAYLIFQWMHFVFFGCISIWISPLRSSWLTWLVTIIISFCQPKPSQPPFLTDLIFTASLYSFHSGLSLAHPEKGAVNWIPTLVSGLRLGRPVNFCRLISSNGQDWSHWHHMMLQAHLGFWVIPYMSTCPLLIYL